MSVSAGRLSKQFGFGALIRLLIALLFAAIVLVPLLTAWVGGFKSNAELLLSPFALPKSWQVNQYVDVFISNAFWRMLGNSLLVTGVTTLGVVALSALADIPSPDCSFGDGRSPTTSSRLACSFRLRLQFCPST